MFIYFFPFGSNLDTLNKFQLFNTDTYMSAAMQNPVDFNLIFRCVLKPGRLEWAFKRDILDFFISLNEHRLNTECSANNVACTCSFLFISIYKSSIFK